MPGTSYEAPRSRIPTALSHPLLNPSESHPADIEVIVVKAQLGVVQACILSGTLQGIDALFKLFENSETAGGAEGESNHFVIRCFQGLRSPSHNAL
ncbi:uncharacterized [Tachysurus ichikawai]